MQDPIAQQVQTYTGRNVRVQVGRQSYIGKVVSVADDIIELVSGEDPVEITLRTDAIDALMVFTQPKTESEWI